jgi:hypothetical protein
LFWFDANHTSRVIPEDFPHVSVKAAAVTILPSSAGVKGEARGIRADKGAVNEALAQDAITRMIGEFDTIFDEEGQLKPMKGEPMEIHMRKDVLIKPLHICNTRKTPYAFQAAAKAKLDDDEENGIIEKVSEPSQWCSAMLFVPKPGGKVRSVLDLVHLNKYVERPTHPFPTPRDIVAQIPCTSTCFAVFDACNGYWQIPLDEALKALTTFITEFGRYRYLRAPMGLVSSGTSSVPERIRHYQAFLACINSLMIS